MAEKFRVNLPKKYDLVVGDAFQLYYRGVIEAPNPYVYSIVSICDKGRNFPRYFEYAPSEPGEHKLTIKVYDAQRNRLDEGETTLKVVVPKEPEKCTNILCIGTSTTAGGEWVGELNRCITGKGGEPAALGYKNAVKFIGTCKPAKYPDVALTAYGGWHWDSYLTNAPSAMWVKCDNNRQVDDQHSLWQDENGAIWQLETLQIDYLKFNRWKDHTSPRPTKGPLVHYANAADTSPLNLHVPAMPLKLLSSLMNWARSISRPMPSRSAPRALMQFTAMLWPVSAANKANKKDGCNCSRLFIL